jgi:hypothetical protein
MVTSWVQHRIRLATWKHCLQRLFELRPTHLVVTDLPGRFRKNPLSSEGQDCSRSLEQTERFDARQLSHYGVQHDQQ